MAAMRLLERDAPLATLHRILATVPSGGGRLAFIEGEAGVGKTSLLGAFKAAVGPDVEVLVGACDPLSTPRPLGPLVDVAAALDPTLVALLRGGASRNEVQDALLLALRDGRRPGIVLVLEDLHWADEASLDALQFIGRRIASTQALVVGSYRDDEVGRQHPLRAVVGELATSPAVERIRLEPLTVTAVTALAEGSGLDGPELHHLTGGNPFYVTEVIAGAPARIPPTVRVAVLARAARLSGPALRTLEAAAVIGLVVDPTLLNRIVESPATEECLARGLLLSDDATYRFRHEVARQAILEAIDPATRIDLNARVLRALERQPAGTVALARLAHHAEAARDGEAVLRYAPQAGREAAASGAHRQAAEQLARAIRFADQLPADERATLLAEAGREHAVIGRYDVTIPTYLEAIRIWQGLGEVPRQVAILSDIAKAYVSMGQNLEAEAASAKAMELAAELDAGPEKVEATNTQAYLRMLDRDNAEAVKLGREAIALGTPDPGAIASVVQAWNTVGAARIMLSDFDGVADLEASLQLAVSHGLDRNAASAYGVCASGLGEMYRFADADPWFEDGLRYTTERDLDANRGYLEAWASLVLMHRGDWSRAGALASKVAGGPARGSISGIMAFLALGRLRARRGDPDAWEALDEALEMADRTATLQRIAPVRAARAEAAWLAGDVRRAGEEARAAFDLARRKSHPWHVGELGWWMVKAGEAVPDVSLAAEPWHLQFDGRWREAADAWLALECPYEAARALLEADDTAAVEEAHGTFDRLGARPAAALATRRLRELGATVIPRGRRPTTRSNQAGLTARELEVLGLLASGLQNREIAARLFLSPRTVDHHVSAVLGKLGVASRAAAPAAASKLGIEAQFGQPGRPE